MASSSLQRARAKRRNTKSFQTCIYPNKREIQICPKFKQAWYEQLRKQVLGSLRHRDGETVKVALCLDGNDCYMINGRFVSNCFGFQVPVNVILTYEVIDNRFKMTVVKDEPIEILSSDSSSDDNNDTEGSYASVEAVSEEEDDDYSNYQMPEFRNDRVYGWELLITKAYASSLKAQVLHVPANCFRRLLRGRDSIVMKAQHSGDITKCTLITYERYEGQEEMYISTGWFEFMDANDIRKGDGLQFQLSNPPNVLFVKILRANV